MTASDEFLIAGLRAGRLEAFRELFDLHKDPMLRLANRMLRHREDAEDAVQEMFLVVHRRIASFRGESALSTWLYRVAVNTFLQARRRRGLGDPQELPVTLEAPPSTTGATAAGDEELQVLLDREIDALPLRQRMVFTLAVIEELPQVEVATILELSPGTVRYHLSEARKRLQSRLRKAFELDDVPDTNVVATGTDA